ncbi:MAG: glycosyltransferase family 39 protein [Candidatus Hydrogenedentes bacterium]|nr:glycosyltransferase family 39 protein [Candidatus Hydrogenedentota bacterium]
MSDAKTPRPWAISSLAIIGALALLKLVLHLVYNRWYGYHHDELYFLACGHHLAFGYVDHPPLTPFLARLADELFGQSLTGLRFFPALAGSAAVFLTGLLTRRLGGSPFAQALACVSMIIAPVYLRAGNVLAIPSFEPFYWVLCSYLVVRIIQEDKPRLWLVVGVVAGLGLMNKHTMLFWGLGLAAGLLLTPQRKLLKSPWPYAGGAVAFLLFLPNLIWQIQNGWPTLEFIRRLNEETMSGISALQFLLGQVLYLHPINAPIWIAGLVFFFTGSGKPYRVLGWLFITVLLLLVIAKSKIYYLAPAYPPLLAGGAIAIEHLAARRHWAWLRPAAFAVLTVMGALFVPVALPILTIGATDRYISALTFGKLDNVYELTGDLHGQFGWRERVEAIAQVYNRLTTEEKPSAIIFTAGYGIAGAVDYFGGAHGLPKAYSGTMTYYLWGPPPPGTRTVIAAGIHKEALAQSFATVENGVTVELENVNPGDSPFHVVVCREPRLPLDKAWPQVREW